MPGDPKGHCHACSRALWPHDIGHRFTDRYVDPLVKKRVTGQITRGLGFRERYRMSLRILVASLAAGVLVLASLPTEADARGGARAGGARAGGVHASARGGAVRVGGVHAGGAYRGGAYRGAAVYRGGTAYRGGAYVARGVGAAAVGAAAVGAAAYGAISILQQPVRICPVSALLLSLDRDVPASRRANQSPAVSAAGLARQQDINCGNYSPCVDRRPEA